MSIPTHDIRRDGELFRYCAVCDHHYAAGTFYRHKLSFPHIASVEHRKSMQKWYAVNGV